ncbi:MAG: MerR family transcriptional regulator, partial [Ginsengibacter sp.]
MNSFSISQLSQFSGVKQHTIRIWEQRYNALTPGRSEGNTRYYDGDQLRRLLNIVNLNGAGMKISEIGILSDEELFALAAKLENEDNSNAHAYFISQLINAGLDYDEVAFEKAFSHSVEKCNIKEVYLNILYPLMVRLGIMWSSDAIPPAQEHFLSNLMKQKLFSLINSVAPSKIKSDAWLLFLPEDEFHEIGLLYANYVLR